MRVTATQEGHCVRNEQIIQLRHLTATPEYRCIHRFGAVPGGVLNRTWPALVPLGLSRANRTADSAREHNHKIPP